MKFVLAIIYGYSSIIAGAMPLTESGPLHAVVQRSANTRLTTADRLSTSGLDYMTWASKMVDEGKMYWANSASNTTNVEV